MITKALIIRYMKQGWSDARLFNFIRDNSILSEVCVSSMIRAARRVLSIETLEKDFRKCMEDFVKRIRDLRETN